MGLRRGGLQDFCYFATGKIFFLILVVQKNCKRFVAKLIDGTFQTAEEFWSIFNNVKPSGDLALNSNYHLFKEGVEPMWEDPANKEGGKFVLTIPKKDSNLGKCNEWWLFTVLAVIGETMDASGEEICGCVVTIRKGQDRIALWLKSCDRKACTEVGVRWKKCLEVSNKTFLIYQAHIDAATSGSSFKNEVKFAL